MASREQAHQTPEVHPGDTRSESGIIVQRSERPERSFMNTFLKDIFEALAGRRIEWGRDFQN
jgi:hypothetical protein